ncbi:DNA-binding LacI/PurR family transcriptional regulator [Anaerotaenia torta]|uniref:LacI family DNA-binding transcriptional regulator n=1 Tax=Anaerotaenia torta TaxID=433293 RepID=UPI003D20DF5E
MGVTTKDLARICGVSRATITRALHGTGSIKAETKQMILETAKKLGYQPDLMARSLVKGRSKMIGTVIVDLKNQYFPQMIDAIVRRAKESGYILNISLHGDDKKEEKRLVRALAGYHADGLILNCINKDAAFQEMLGGLGLPYVVLGYRLFENCHTIGIDEYEAAYQAVEFVVSKGYKEVVFVVPPLYDREGFLNTGHGERKEGVEAAAGKLGCRCIVIHGEDYAEQALRYKKAESLTKPAFICSGDVFAGNVMSAFYRQGLFPPKDYGIMGFDRIQMYQDFIPQLTTVDNHVERMGYEAAGMLIDMIEGKEISFHRKMAATIVEGETI